MAEYEIPQLLSGLASKVADCAREYSIEVMEDEDADWKFEVKVVDRKRDFSREGLRAIVLKYEVPVRQRLLGLIPLPRKTVRISQRLSVPEDCMLVKGAHMPVTWRTPTVASLELSGKDTTMWLPGLTIDVPGNAAPAGTELIVRYPYALPGEVERGRNLLCGVKLETRPQASFAEPVTLHLATTQFATPAGGYHSYLASDEAGKWVAALSQAEFTIGRRPPTTHEEIRQDESRAEDFLKPALIPLNWSLSQFGFGPEMAEGVRLKLVGICFTYDQGQGETLFANRDAVRVEPRTKAGDFGPVPGPVHVYYAVTHTGIFTVWYQTTTFGLKKGSPDAQQVGGWLSRSKEQEMLMVLQCSRPGTTETLGALQKLLPNEREGKGP